MLTVMEVSFDELLELLNSLELLADASTVSLGLGEGVLLSLGVPLSLGDGEGEFESVGSTLGLCVLLFVRCGVSVLDRDWAGDDVADALHDTSRVCDTLTDFDKLF